MGYSRDTSGSVLVGPMSESDTNIYNELLGSSDLNIGHYVLSLQNSNGSIQKFGFHRFFCQSNRVRCAGYRRSR